MNDEELKQLWKEQPLRGAPEPSPSQLVAAMESKTSQLRRTLWARDMRELAACVIVGVIFGIYFFAYSAPMARVGSLITVVAAIFIAAKTLYAQRTTRAAKADAPVIESLRVELRAVHTQSELLRTVGWWYLLPLAVGTLVFVWGMPSNSLAFKIGFTVVSLALDVGIYWLNKRARTTQLLPVERQLEALLHSAQTGDALDQTHLASLRPIVVSLAATERIRPVEFKVAFWQLALYGLPGFIGIWFFLMLGLPGKPVHVSQPVHFDATNRYAIIARKVVDLFNAGDYAAVQKLYDDGMGKAFPPKETAAFYTRLSDGFGKIETIEGPIGKGYDGWTAFRLNCQNGELTMSLELDDDDYIAGIYFKPVVQPFANMVGKRLLWIVPFILAGLLYSWFLQKTTRRAVGISALGIHLNKGQQLILWDEIKEVRPLRFLNIRSLWLIRDSGEKTLMRWTSLERHGDLKAAVENNAPADHPIRKHLSLLKRS